MDRLMASPDEPEMSRKPNATRPLTGLLDRDETGKLVMVIDDSRVICRIVQHALAEYSVATVPFTNGIDAINALSNGDVPVPDLVVLDIEMPDLDGFDVVSILHSKDRFKQVPIVILSSHDNIINRFRTWRAGVVVFISKPAEKLALVRKVFEALHLDPPEPHTLDWN